MAYRILYICKCVRGKVHFATKIQIETGIKSGGDSLITNFFFCLHNRFKIYVSLYSVQMKSAISFLALLISTFSLAQVPVDLSDYKKDARTSAIAKDGVLTIGWPIGNKEEGSVSINLYGERPLVASMRLSSDGVWKEVASALDPVFILTVGKRDLTKESGWNIFFDKTAYLPHKAYRVSVDKQSVKVVSVGS